MSINSTVKEEILSAKTNSDCCRKAFLAGVVLSSGSLPIERGGFGLIIQNPSGELIEKCVSIISQLTKAEPIIFKKDKEMSLGQRVVYEVQLPSESAAPLLATLGILEPPYGLSEKVPAWIAKKACCRKSFLRGMFCSSGTLWLADDCEGANTRGYSLDIALSSEEAAQSVSELLASMGIAPGIRARKNNLSVYLKDSEKIGDFFKAVGSNQGLFALQDVLMSRSLRNNANRLVNCEVANIDKTLTASTRQIEAIATIEKTLGLAGLDEALRDTAEVRKAHPGATMEELLPFLRFPTSKSGLNHRLRRLIEIANESGGK